MEWARTVSPMGAPTHHAIGRAPRLAKCAILGSAIPMLGPHERSPAPSPHRPARPVAAALRPTPDGQRSHRHGRPHAHGDADPRRPGHRCPRLLAVAIVLVTVVAVDAAHPARRLRGPRPAPRPPPRERRARRACASSPPRRPAHRAVAEAPVLVAFAVSFLVTPHSWLPLLVALPVRPALFWWHAWPSPRTAAAVEEGLEADGAESHLSETLGFRCGSELGRHTAGVCRRAGSVDRAPLAPVQPVGPVEEALLDEVAAQGRDVGVEGTQPVVDLGLVVPLPRLELLREVVEDDQALADLGRDAREASRPRRRTSGARRPCPAGRPGGRGGSTSPR